MVSLPQNPGDKPVPKLPKEWHPQQAKLLKSWAEVASSYRWMHNQAYMIYKKKNLWFMIPLIVMSTVTGTANFAQSTFPETIRPYVPQIIGAINLISAIMTTIYQFLKISEFMESHRISSINYGKLARTITIELSLPVKDRSSGGAECVKISRTDIDRLIEQSPAIPKNVLAIYETKFAGRGLAEPEIIVINPVDVYEDLENKTANTVAEAGAKLKGLIQKPFLVKNSSSPTTRKNSEVKTEINSLKENNTFSSIISELTNKIKPRSPKQKNIPKFDPIPENKDNHIIVDLPTEISNKTPSEITETLSKIIETPSEITETLGNIIIPPPYITPVPSIPSGPPSETDQEIEEIKEIVDNIVNDIIETSGTIADDLDLLRSSKIVSGKKS
jgi:hypothetical protein